MKTSDIKSILKPGDLISIPVHPLADNGMCETQAQVDALNYIYENPDEVYTVLEILPHLVSPIVVYHPVLGKTSFAYEEVTLVEHKTSEYPTTPIKLGQFLMNRDLDVNCKYRIYIGIWNDPENGELLYDSVHSDFELNDIWLGYNIDYITINQETGYLIIEIG